MPGQWIVLVEATDAGASGDVDRDGVLRLLAALERHCDGSGGGALHSSDRYALQLRTTASGPAEALISVLSRWADAHMELDLPPWKVVRTEVLTPEELEKDERNHLRDDKPVVGLAARARPRSRCRPRRTFPPQVL